MTYSHEAVAAVPVGGAIDNALLRALISGRIPYALGPADNPADFTAQDPDTGDVPPALFYDGKIFFYDAADATTAADGVTCLVSSDGKRFKLTGAAGWVDSVLDKDLVAEPGSPSPGDAYLLPAAPTGTHWSSHGYEIALYTAHGWEFSTANAGRLVYVEDEESYYHFTAAGVWTLGIGIGGLGTNDVAPSNVLGGRTHFAIENQTTNAPPSPAAGTAYIVGPSPTGAWAGKTGQIAIRNKLANGWLFVTQSSGLTAFDKALARTVVSVNGLWVDDSGAYVARYASAIAGDTAITIEDDGDTTGGSTVGYVYDSTTGPTSSERSRAIHTYAPSISARKAGAQFELDFWGLLSPEVQWVSGSGSGTVSYTITSIALFVDNEASPREWHQIDETLTASRTSAGTTAATFAAIRPRKFAFTLADTSAHTIKLRIFGRLTSVTNTRTKISSLKLRRANLIMREAS